MILHVQTMLKQPICCDSLPGDHEDAQSHPPRVDKIDEDRGCGQKAERNQRVTKNAHGCVEVDLTAFAHQQID